MSIAVPLYGFGASGGAGGTLTVTAPANVTVTVSKDGKSKIKNSGTSGVVVFKGLASGTWKVTITGDGKTAQKNVVVTTDKWQYKPMYINTSYKNATAPTVNIESDSMMITQPTYVNGCAYVYNREIDMTTLNTLRFDGELSTAMTNFTDAACLCIWTSLGTYVTDNRVAYINFKTASPKQIDVSALTGMHRVGFFLFSNGTYAKVNSLLIE